ncbi:vitamin K epoxide reductase family protein [Luteimonas sp. RIT-PG2_3]
MSRKTRGHKQHRQGVAQDASRPSSTAPAKPRLPADRLVLGLALLGMLLTAYLTLVAWSASAPAFCASGSGCDVVQQSQWSRLLGLPIALWGCGLYALLALVAWRARSRLQRWRWSWRLSLWGVAISVYLTLAGWIALQAVCLWCLLSLAIISAIFVLQCLRRPEAAPGARWTPWLLGNGLVVVALLATLHVSSTGLLQQRPEDPRLRALAEHLEQSGAKYYGASWCPNCREQAKMFGASEPRLPYVECSPNGRGSAMAFDCVSARITGFPTWIIEGQQYVEVIEPERLARMTGFDWNRFGKADSAD